MQRSIAKRHHYIPQLIIRNFAGNQGKVWAYDKRRGNIFASNPINVFVESNLYQQYDSKRRQYHVKPEERLAEIESDAVPALEHIIENVRQNNRPNLPADLHECWMRFYLSLLQRNLGLQQIVREGTDKQLIMDNRQVYSDGLIIPFQVYKELRPEEHEAIYKGEMANIVAGIGLRWERDIQRRLRETGCVFAYIPQPSDKQFVLGNFIAILPPEAGRNSGSFLPITPDIAVVYTDKPKEMGIYPLIGDAEDEPDRINHATFQKSTQIVSHSEKLLKVLLKRFTDR